MAFFSLSSRTLSSSSSSSLSSELSSRSELVWAYVLVIVGFAFLAVSACGSVRLLVVARLLVIVGESYPASCLPVILVDDWFDFRFGLHR
jgi:hypothetical protein